MGVLRVNGRNVAVRIRPVEESMKATQHDVRHRHVLAISRLNAVIHVSITAILAGYTTDLEDKHLLQRRYGVGPDRAASAMKDRLKLEIWLRWKIEMEGKSDGQLANWRYGNIIIFGCMVPPSIALLTYVPRASSTRPTW